VVSDRGVKRWSGFNPFAALAAPAAAVCLPLAMGVVLSRDECFSWRMTRFPTSEMLTRVRDDAHPPLYYLLLRAWVATAGATPLGLRGPSILCGLGTVVLLPLAVRAAAGPGARTAGGEWLAGVLAAASAMQAAAAINARMYALGALLCVGSTWLLLRALRADGPGWWAWWTAYGLAVAAFGATHHFAAFSVLAQAAFVAIEGTVTAYRTGARSVQGLAAGCALAAAVAALALAPMVPLTLEQVRAVRAGFWIPPVTAVGVERMVVNWMADIYVPRGVLQHGLLAVFSGVIALTLVRGGRAGRLFALLAFVPWVGAITASVVLGRPLVLDRCFVFAHVGLLGLWGVAWQALPGLVPRLAFAWLIASTTLGGLCDFVAAVPGEPPAWAAAADSLRGRVADTDTFLLSDYREINRFRYYTTQAGLPWLRVLAQVPDGGAGHVVHRASLTADEMLPDGSPWPAAYPGRVWGVAAGAVVPPAPVRDRAARWWQTFASGGDTVSVTVLD
jgi:hypothetical protein